MFPGYLDLIIQTMTFSSLRKEPFYRHTEDFCITICALQAYQSAAANLVFNNITEFNALFKIKADLVRASAVLTLPEYTRITNSLTIEQARTKMKERLKINSKAEIRKNLVTLLKLTKCNHGYINLITSPDILQHIASYTGDRQVHNNQKANEISHYLYREITRCRS